MKLSVTDIPATELLSRGDVGCEQWWSQLAALGLPLVEGGPARPSKTTAMVVLTFFWRDPYGCESSSKIKAVYIDVNCVTDHHTFDPPSMQRVIGTDVWYWQVQLEEDWRGSYKFIPVTEAHLPPQGNTVAVQPRSAEMLRLVQRRWWRSLQSLAEFDPLNRVTPARCPWSASRSAVHLPASPRQQAWENFDRCCELQVYPRSPACRAVQKITWNSRLLGNQRDVWIYATTSSPNADNTISLSARPLVILLDGQFWAEEMPVFSALDAQTGSEVLQPGVFVLIDAIDSETRGRELACSQTFWEAVQSELLPRVAERESYTSEPGSTVVAGQSLGGLAAMYAGLNWPHRFGCVISQSGSFWWPNIELMKQGPLASDIGEHSTGWLIQQVQKGLGSNTSLNILQEVGRRETVLANLNGQLYRELIGAGHQVRYSTYSGGHDYLCWRGGLIDGLTSFLGGPKRKKDKNSTARISAAEREPTSL